MSRHLGNLQRVLNKLQMRYGEQDAVVQQLQQEITQQQANPSDSPALPGNERRRVAGRAAQRSNDPLKALAPRAWRLAQNGNPRSPTH